jgi:hypothetical protein
MEFKKASPEKQAVLLAEIDAEFEEEKAYKFEQAKKVWMNVNDLDRYDPDLEGEDTPDDDESDESDPDFEVPEEECVKEGVDHEYDSNGVPSCDPDLFEQFKEVLRKAETRGSAAIGRLEALGTIDELELDLSSEDSDDECMEEDDDDYDNDEEEEDDEEEDTEEEYDNADVMEVSDDDSEWAGIPDD